MLSKFTNVHLPFYSRNIVETVNIAILLYNYILCILGTKIMKIMIACHFILVHIEYVLYSITSLYVYSGLVNKTKLW